SVNNLANGGSASNLGASSNVASNLVLDGGTLQYLGNAVSTDRLFTLTQNGGALDASGSGAVNLANSGNVAFSGSGARTLTLTGFNTGENTLAAGLGDGTGGATSLVKTGSGRWIVTGSTTHSGGTTVTAGTLTLRRPATSATPISQNPQVLQDMSSAFRSVSRVVSPKGATQGRAALPTLSAAPIAVTGLSDGAPAINALSLPEGLDGLSTAPAGTSSGPMPEGKKKKTGTETEGAAAP
ncbi:MAG: autotransporter-associated beta strand repeat-containing protein, partial [Nitrospirae bacterium]|nr:autotransporter-associated beta strand repeat-containing protein [Nitrospirota bacterium]